MVRYFEAVVVVSPNMKTYCVSCAHGQVHTFPKDRTKFTQDDEFEIRNLLHKFPAIYKYRKSCSIYIVLLSVTVTVL